MEENPELTSSLEMPWFKRFMSLALDSIFWGYSLIEFGNLINDPQLMFDKVTLIPREHVIPEYNRIVKDPSDEWKKGIDFTAPPFSAWCIGVGEPKDLGLLLNVSPQAISKKNMASYWDQFGEIFGMPIRIGKTQSRDPKELTKLETMLSEMGAAAWGLFPDGTEIEIKETTRGDAYNVYDKRIERCNSEMSKMITGVTMTMDNGSSRSQSEVHERQFDDVCASDADMLHDVINVRLFPFLRQHGFNFDGHRFEWDETIEYTPEDQLAIDTMLINNFDIDPKYFADKYNVPIIGKKEQPPASQSFFS
jgi:phage gp29-like protein